MNNLDLRIHLAAEMIMTAAILAVFFLAGCGGGSAMNGGAPGGPGSSTDSAVLIYPPAASVPVNGTIQFSAFLPNQPGSAFTWTVSGGGSIDSSGVFTAPAAPASVTVTATAQGGGTGLTGAAAITITAAQGVLVSPSALAIPAGVTQTFSATVNGQAASGVTWQVNGTPGGDAVHGTIDSSGDYLAPLSPPPGGSAIITAITGTGSSAVSGTAAATILFSNASLNGLYAFSYKGNDSSGFLAVAGSFMAQGVAGSPGQILNGVQDSIHPGTSGAAHTTLSGSFTVNPDGSATATLANNVTWQFTLLSNPLGGSARQALLIRFDSSATGSGTIDAQNPALLGASAFSGNYAFGLSGLDGSGRPLAIAGRFFADGVATIPLGSAIQDINDNGATTLSSTSTSGTGGDASLQGDFEMDGTLPDSGRGTVSLTSDNTVFGGSVTLQFAFYMVDSTHLKVVETDNKAVLGGDFYSAAGTPADGAFTAALALPQGNYAFTVGGMSSNGAYAAGGIFNSNGSSVITGVLDINGGVTSIRLNGNLSGSSYAFDANTGRTTLRLAVNNGPAANFVGYPVAFNTASGTVRMVELIELDKNAIASGLAFPQASANSLQGNYALNISGVPGPQNGAVEEDVVGQVDTIGGTSFSGTLNINNFALKTLSPHQALTSSTSIAGTASNGRGTATLATSVASFPLAYYIVDADRSLLLETDGARVTTGLLIRQF